MTLAWRSPLVGYQHIICHTYTYNFTYPRYQSTISTHKKPAYWLHSSAHLSPFNRHRICISFIPMRTPFILFLIVTIVVLKGCKGNQVKRWPFLVFSSKVACLAQYYSRIHQRWVAPLISVRRMHLSRPCLDGVLRKRGHSIRCSGVLAAGSLCGCADTVNKESSRLTVCASVALSRCSTDLFVGVALFALCQF